MISGTGFQPAVTQPLDVIEMDVAVDDRKVGHVILPEWCSAAFGHGRPFGGGGPRLGLGGGGARSRRRWVSTARPTARISIAPLNSGSTKKGAPSWLSPATATASTATARTVPQTLGRPGTDRRGAEQGTGEGRQHQLLADRALADPGAAPAGRRRRRRRACPRRRRPARRSGRPGCRRARRRAGCRRSRRGSGRAGR